LSFASWALELAVVHQAADRGNGHGCDLDQVDLRFLREAHGFHHGNDAELVAFHADQAYLGGVDLPVDANRLVIVSDAKNPLSNQ